MRPLSAWGCKISPGSIICRVVRCLNVSRSRSGVYPEFVYHVLQNMNIHSFRTQTRSVCRYESRFHRFQEFIFCDSGHYYIGLLILAVYVCRRSGNRLNSFNTMPNCGPSAIEHPRAAIVS
jgi:hypothetical protein